VSIAACRRRIIKRLPSAPEVVKTDISTSQEEYWHYLFPIEEGRNTTIKNFFDRRMKSKFIRTEKCCHTFSWLRTNNNPILDALQTFGEFHEIELEMNRCINTSILSVINFSPSLLAIGLYVPRYSKHFPSRGERASAATIR
jgi:hypothetical protein